MRQLIRDAHGELLRAIGEILRDEPATQDLGARGLPGLTVSGVSTEAWAAMLYDGARHRLDVTLRGSEASILAARAAISAKLPQMEFDLPGHLVAGIDLISAKTTGDSALSICEMRFEALTIAD